MILGSTATEVTKMILDKLSEAASVAQTTVAAGLPHVATAFVAQRIAFVVTAFVLMLGGCGVAWSTRGRPMVPPHPNNPNPSGWFVLRVMGVIAMGLGFLAVLALFPMAYAAWKDPLGAFILSLL